MKRFIQTAVFVVLFLTCFLTEFVVAEPIGKIVALRGTAVVERAGKEIEGKVKLDIEARDTVKTSSNSKVKLLFVDGSILTLGEKTELIVKEFIDGKGERGKSIFNLLDGKMRSVVGHTQFEVETPSAVAAARGTVIYFDVSALYSRPVTTIVCLEGTVDVTSLLADVPGSVVLTAGNMVTIKTGEPITPVRTPESFFDAAGDPGLNDEGAGGGPGENSGLPTGMGEDINFQPPINQEPLQPTKVDINIEIPM